MLVWLRANQQLGALERLDQRFCKIQRKGNTTLNISFLPQRTERGIISCTRVSEATRRANNSVAKIRAALTGWQETEGWTWNDWTEHVLDERIRHILIANAGFEQRRGSLTSWRLYVILTIARLDTVKGNESIVTLLEPVCLELLSPPPSAFPLSCITNSFVEQSWCCSGRWWDVTEQCAEREISTEI